MYLRGVCPTPLDADLPWMQTPPGGRPHPLDADSSRYIAQNICDGRLDTWYLRLDTCVCYSSFSQTHNIGNNAHISIRGFTTQQQNIPVTKCYPQWVLSPGPLLSGLTCSCATWFLDLDNLVRSFSLTSKCQVSSERRVLDLESEFLASVLIRRGVTFCYWNFSFSRSKTSDTNIDLIAIFV